MASQITSLTIVYSTVYSGADQRKHESSASLAFVRGIHWWPVHFLHKGPVMRKMFPFDDVIISRSSLIENRMKNAKSTHFYWYTVRIPGKLRVSIVSILEKENGKTIWIKLYVELIMAEKGQSSLWWTRWSLIKHIHDDLLKQIMAVICGGHWLSCFIRKSGDFPNRIWQQKLLGIEKLFHSKIIGYK